jgi:hypothetical protein
MQSVSVGAFLACQSRSYAFALVLVACVKVRKAGKRSKTNSTPTSTPRRRSHWPGSRPMASRSLAQWWAVCRSARMGLKASISAACSLNEQSLLVGSGLDKRRHSHAGIFRMPALPSTKGQRRGCPSRVDGLELRIETCLPAAGWQAIFLGATEPRAARPCQSAAGAAKVQKIKPTAKKQRSLLSTMRSIVSPLASRPNRPSY